MRNYHLHHPFNDSPPALPWPTDPPGDCTQAHRPHAQSRESNQANARYGTLASGLRTPSSNPTPPQAPPPPAPPKQARRKRGLPAPSYQQARIYTRATTSQPAAPPPDPPDKLSVRPAGPPPHPHQASSSSSIPPQAPPQPVTYQEFQKGTKVQQLLRNDHTGDWIWCEGTIQYRLEDLGRNGAVPIWVTWHRQKELDQGDSATDKQLRDTLELTSAHPIQRLTPENKVHRGTKYTGEPPPEWSQGLPASHQPKRPPPSKTSPGPSPPP